MKYRNYLSTTMLAALLSGCGGGGGDDSATELSVIVPLPATSNVTSSVVVDSSVQTTPTTNTETAIVETATRTRELRVGEDFDFTSSSSIDVQINLSSEAGLESYLTICVSPMLDEIGTFSNDEQCLVRTPLENGIFQGQIARTNDVNNLVVSVWGYEGLQPRTWHWSYLSDPEEINITD